jgi:hypothetical protein
MKTTLVYLLTFSALALAASTAPAQGTAAKNATTNPVKGYEAFRLVRTRNIFDPNRRGARTESAPPPVTTSARRANFINLTGTMVTAGKSLAFFSGSRPEYSKVVGENGKVADFTIKSITPSQVEVELGGKLTLVMVGSSVPLQGSVAMNAEALLPAPGTEPAAVGVTGAAPGSASTSAPAAGPAGSADDVLRRMMERRQKETSR